MAINTEKAVREAKRWEAAKELRTSGAYEFDPFYTGKGFYVRKFENGVKVQTYLVWEHETTGSLRCSCPDFEKHEDFCKHTLAADIEREEIAQVEAEEALLESAESSNGVEPLCY